MKLEFGGNDWMRATFVASLVLATALLSFSPAMAQTPMPEMRALAEKVLVASGNDARVVAITRGVAMQDTLTNALHSALPEATSAWDQSINAAVQSELKTEANAFYEENVRIYATRFTEAELTDMLNFYSSPGGTALVAATPAIVQEKLAFGRQLGRDAVARMIKAVCAVQTCSARR